MSPETWTKVGIRVDARRWIAYFALIGLLAGVGMGAIVGSPSAGVVMILATWIAGPVGHYLNTLRKFREEKGLPWEEQRVVLDENGYSTTYESGFTAQVPWAKFRSAHRVPEGILLRMEGRGQAFIPAASLDPESEGLILRKVSKA